MSSPVLAQSLPDGSEELQSLKNVFLISQHHLRKTAAALLNQRGFKSSGWLFLDGTFGLVLVSPRWEKHQGGEKHREKTKKATPAPRWEHSLPVPPCMNTTAGMNLGFLDGSCEDLGFWFAELAQLQGWGLCPVPPEIPPAAINTPRAPRQLLQPKPTLLLKAKKAKRPPGATGLGQLCIAATTSQTQT